MRKILLFVLLFTGVLAFSQTANKTACTFTPDFSINNVTQCLTGNSYSFTNSSGEGSFSLGSSAATATHTLSGFSIVANSGQTLIIRILPYGTATQPRTLEIKNFTVNGSTSAGVTISTWPLTATVTGTNTGAGAASITVGNEGLGNNPNFVDGGYSTNGHKLGYTTNWPTAVTGNLYQQFSITPNTGFNLTINSLTFTKRIAAGANALNVAIQYSLDGGATFFAVPFTSPASIGGSGLTYDWDFGDGTTPHPTTLNATHSYTAPGSYPVKLTVTGSACSDFIIKTVTVVGNVLYVNAAATGGNNGSSWANAFTNLQPAIDAAVTCGAQVWVAAGTYKPTSYPWASAGSNNRDFAFALKNNVAIYGGFTGTETLLTQRNFTTNITTLSGDIGTVGVNTDNCYHVIVGSGINNTSILDGFTISNGNANVSGSLTVNGNAVNRNDGAGMINRNATHTINNCIFSNNTVVDEGGAMYNIAASPTLSNCTFSNNTAKYGGAMNNFTTANPSITSCVFSNNSSTTIAGAVRNDNSSPTFTNCIFSNNTATSDGGGIYNEGGASPSLTGCSFTSNIAVDGGGMYSEDALTLSLTNCTFTTNTVTSEGGGMYNKSTTATITSCSFLNNSATGSGDGGGIFNNTTNGTISNCTFNGNTSGDDGGGYYGASSSPTITNCTFNSNNADEGGGYFATNSSPTVTNCTFTANHCVTRGGGMRNSGGAPIITGCLFQGNISDEDGGGMVNNNGSTAIITNCIFKGNLAIIGATATCGGLRNESSATTVTNCIFTGNMSKSGGAIYNNNTPVSTFINCTIYGNDASSVAGGIRNNSSNAILKNCIVWGNTAPLSPAIGNSSATPVITYSTIEGGYTGTGNISTNPLFVNAANPIGTDNIWGTADDGLQIVCTSPAKNAGTATGAPSTDIIGNTRTNPDMGAYEQTALPVTPSVSIAITTGTQTICAGISVTFTATPTNGGANPTYQWQINGSNVGTNSNTFTSNTLVNNDVVTCTITPGTDICASPLTSLPSAGITMTVTTPPSATISYTGTPYCSNGTTANVTLTGTTGGVFSSTTGLTINATTGAIDLAASTPNTYTVTYTVAAAGGCALYSTTTSITITAAPFATISYAGSPYCSNSGTATVTLTGTSGGTFSSTTGLSINSTTGDIDIATSTPNTYTVTYTVAAANGCALYSTTTSITITAAPAATINYASPYCSNSGTASVTLTGTTGGTFSSTTGLSINASTGDINLAASTPNTYTVTYTVAAASGCALYSTTTAITITAAPSATISYAGSPYCSNSVTAIVTLTGTTGGAFSSTTGLAINSTTGDIDITTSTPNTYTVTYTVVAANGCALYSTTTSIIISPAPSATINYASPYCSNIGTANVTLTGTTGGVFSSAAGLSINSSTGAINLSASTPNTYTVTYTITAANGCGLYSTTTSVTINQAPSANIFYASTTFCSNVGTANVTITGTTGGSFSSTLGLVIDPVTGAINLAASTPNTYTVTYSIAAANGCGLFSTTTAITIKAAPSANISYAGSPYCSNSGTASVTFTGTTGGTFSSTTGLSINASTGDINLAASTPNTYTVTYTVAAAGGCALYSTNTQIIITSAPTATISYIGSPYCSNTGTINVTLTGTTGGNFSSTTGLSINSTTGAIDIATSTAGTYTVNYVIAAAGGCNTFNTTTSVTITTPVSASINYTATPYCSNAGTASVTLIGSNGGTFSSTSGLIINTANGDIDLAASTAGTYIVTYTIPASGGCALYTTSTSITITKTPSATINYALSAYCQNAGTAVATITGTTGGTFSSTTGLSINSTTGDINLSASTPNTYTVTYSVAASGGCSIFSTTTQITITAVPFATIAYSGSPYCSNAGTASVAITGTTGGTFSSTAGLSINSTTGDINTATSTPNTYTVIYTVAAAGGCTVYTTSTLVTITNNPTATISYGSVSYCQNAGNAIPTFTGTTGGTFSSTPGLSINSVTGNIILSTSTPNTYTVTYTVAALGGCSVFSTTATIIIDQPAQPTIGIAITSGSQTICAGTIVTFTATTVNGGSNPSYQWQINGSNAGTNSSTFTTSSLVNFDGVKCILTSNETCVTIPTATSNGILMTVNPNIIASININASTTTTCAGSAITFNATTINGGTTPSYQWQVNAVNAGTNANTFSSSSLNNGDIVTCILSTSEACATPNPATSNSITVTINPVVTPTITIATATTTICAGTAITFTSTIANGGSNPFYQWQVNGINAGTNSNTFTSTTLNNTDVVTCVFTSNANCLSTTNASSNSITITVNPNVTPTINIITSSTNICAGTSATFSAITTNEGSTAFYQWKVNGVNVGTNTSTYISNTLSNGDMVTCTLTSSATCATTNTVVSNTLTMTINPNLTPTINISTTTPTVCTGSAVTFTAFIINGGSNPSYQWQINSSNVGINSSTFTSNTLNNGDIISCILTSNAICATATTITSNTITITVNSILTPFVNIVASATTICAGTAVTFTASPVNGGSAPTYQWKVNSINVGTNSNIFTSSTINNNDIISCVLTSNANCLSTTTATSNTITMVVNANVTPTISIATASTNICSGTNVAFTASATNTGVSPIYQWMIGSINVGSNNSTYNSTTLNNGDIIKCILTSNANCLLTSSASSNIINMTVNANVTPSISITASATNVCPNTNITFTATGVNTGTTPNYQWKINGLLVGTNNPIFNSNTLSNGDQVSCELTSSITCVTVSTTPSNTITIGVSAPVTPTISISTATTNVCSSDNVLFTATPTNEGATPSYQWKINNVNSGTNSATFTASLLTNGDKVSCILTSSLGCLFTPTASSNVLTMNVTTSVTPTIVIKPTVDSVCEKTSITFSSTITNGGPAPIYQWMLNNTQEGNSTTSFTFTSKPGDIVYCKLISNATCATAGIVSSNIDTLTIYSLPVVNAGDDKTILTGNTVQLIGKVLGGYDSIRWTPSNTLNNDSILNPLAKPFVTTTYKLTAASLDGCLGNDEVTITVVDRFVITNIFTPNGDGINDTWQVRDLSMFGNCRIDVFDRGGRLVYASNGYATPWDGTKNSSPLPTGTYYYIIDLKDGNKPMKGSLTIIR